jgi:putative ABC transport system permease protein
MLLKMAFRNILRQKTRTTFTLIVLAFGYLVMALAMSIAEGSYNNVIKLFTSAYTGHVQIHHPKYLEEPTIYKVVQHPQNVIKRIENTKLKYSLRVKGVSFAYGEEESTPVIIFGVDPQKENKTTKLQNKITKGKYLSQNINEVLIPQKMSNYLNLNINDYIYLIGTGFDGSIANEKFKVIGILKEDILGITPIIYTNTKTAQEYFSLNNNFHEVLVSGENYQKSQQIKKTIQQQDNYNQISTWSEVQKEFYDSMQADKKGNIVTLLIIFLMVALTVLNTILMSVLERMKEFSLLKALGANNFTISRIIFYEINIITFIGLLFGLFLFVPINYWFVNVGFNLPEPIDIGGMAFEKILGEFSYLTTALPCLVIWLSTTTASFFPILKATTIKPAQGLES